MQRPQRGRFLQAGQTSDKFSFYGILTRNWRQYYLVSPDSPTASSWCTCDLTCSSGDNVGLYMSIKEDYWMHDDWPLWSTPPFGCNATVPRRNQTCRVNRFIGSQWYCYVAVNGPGSTRGCTVNCSFY